MAAPNSKKANKPEKELRNYAKTKLLQPGETETITMKVATEDIAYQNGLATLKLFDAEGIKYEYYTAPGGHTWYTWRNNLHQLAQRLFK